MARSPYPKLAVFRSQYYNIIIIIIIVIIITINNCIAFLGLSG